MYFTAFSSGLALVLSMSGSVRSGSPQQYDTASYSKLASLSKSADLVKPLSRLASTSLATSGAAGSIDGWTSKIRMLDSSDKRLVRKGRECLVIAT